jgi:hypothetical protein
MQPVSKQRIDKHTLLETVFSIPSMRSGYKEIVQLTGQYPAWEIETDTYLLKLQRLQNKVLGTIGNFARCTPVRDLHTAFNLP